LLLASIDQNHKPSNMEDCPMEITIALGGGGSKGVSHIGVLRVMEREGIRVRAIAGTSMGGVIGAYYASGMSLDEIADWMQEGDRRGLMRTRPDGPGLIGMRAVEAWLQEKLGEKAFAELPIPFGVTATDLETGEEVTLREGSVVDGVLSTIALPGIFPPKTIAEHRMVDGGVTDPVPVRLARTLYPGVVVAVALWPPRSEWAIKPSPSPLARFPMIGLVERLRPGKALKIFIRSMEISTRTYGELRLEIDKPEVVIRPDVAHIGLMDRGSVEEVAMLGEQAAELALPNLRAEFTPMRRMSRWLKSLLGDQRPDAA
jgi:NTE family protein